MGKQVFWQRPGDPYGPYCGQCCDNCRHFWDDGETFGCDLGQELWDNRYLADYLAGFETYVDYLNDKCPDWVSKFINNNQQQETLI